MSLQLAAQHLADKGRGPDTTLVHMSNKEVKSLNDLAMAHGGQLTINPQTGLPEAGFLSSILPMVAGAALTGMSGGVINPMTAGLIVGGGSMLLNPKAGLMGGIMAGLGAYGGGSLGQGLGNLASSEAGATAANAATTASEEAARAELVKQQALQESAKQSVLSSPTAQNIELASKFTPDYINNSVQSAREFAADSFVPKTPIPTGMDAVYQGAKSVVTNPSLDKLKAIGGGSYSSLARTGLAAAAPAIAEPAKFTPPPTSATAGKQIVPHYKFSPGMQTPTPTASPTGVENVYFKPQYTALSDEEAKQMYPGYGAYVPPTTAADGGLMGYAGGGPVEAMSNDNAIGANTGFPQAYLHNNAYATPYQTPISQNVLTGAGDVSVDPYTGEQRMAAGGVSYDPQTQRYTGGIADALKPENTDVNIYNDTGGPASGGGPASASSSSSSNGSPTGSTIGDAGYAISNQSISPVAAAIAGAMMDAMSPTSSISANAVNGMDASSDAASAAAAADASGGAPGMGGGSDASVGDSGAAGGGGGGSATGEARGGLSPRFNYHMATGGISDAGYNLGGYSDGGRLLRGPGDGVSDSIPAVIGKKQPARLADGEFVVPARIVSELGNGSTEAGARKLYAMMDRIQAARGKTVGKGRVAKNSRSEKYLPA
jgi:hypothetical protein